MLEVDVLQMFFLRYKKKDIYMKVHNSCTLHVQKLTLADLTLPLLYFLFLTLVPPQFF